MIISPGNEDKNESSSEDNTAKPHHTKSSPHCEYNNNSDPDPRGRNGDSSDDDYKEDPADLWALRQHQLQIHIFLENRA